ncbi:MAG: DUF3500 domain-containing protein [Pirellulales bacterium]
MARLASSSSCSDCATPVHRRSFLQAAAGAAAVAGVTGSGLFDARFAHAAPTAKSAGETAAAQLFASLSADQKKTICFGFDHELRRRINANWHITKPLLKDSFYSNEQRALVDQIVRNITSPEGYDRFQKQMEYDDGGVGSYSMAFFGEPESGKFEWELTGRHLTMRADGNSVDQAAFGGPIVYGHGEEDAKDNLFHYQTRQVNEVFHALDSKQAQQALIEKAPAEAAVKIQGEKGAFPGLPVSALSADQKKLVEATLKTLLGPYRQEDVDEVFAILKASGGLDRLHLAFYQQGDLDNDKKWDIWRVEGPQFVWHFRGAPHVHAYVNIGAAG